MKKGMTLIEVIMAMVIIGIAFYTLIALYITLAPRNVLVENINKKISLAQEKIEEYLSRPFSKVTSVSPATITTPSFGQYKYSIVVTYVATSDLNTSVTGPTPFKNVKVRVWGGPLDTLGTVELTSLMVTYEVK
jgi:prepilin-type N-terminal cleavage/methylation domain-containing protein